MMRLSAFFVKISTVKNLVGHPIFFTNHKRQESLEVRRNHVMVELSSLFDLSAHCVGFFFSTWAFWSHFVAAKKWLCCYGDQKCQAYFVSRGGFRFRQSKLIWGRCHKISWNLPCCKQWECYFQKTKNWPKALLTLKTFFIVMSC